MPPAKQTSSPEHPIASLSRSDRVVEVLEPPIRFLMEPPVSNFRGSEIDEFRVGPGIRKRRRLLALATAKLLKLAKPRHTHTDTDTHGHRR